MDDQHMRSIEEIWARLEDQQRENVELRRQIEELRGMHTSITSTSEGATSTSPRRLSRAGILKVATAGAAATLGAGALIQTKAPITSAADGDPVTAGFSNMAESATSLIYNGTTSPGAILFVEDGTSYSPSELTDTPAVIAGYAVGTNVSYGVIGYSHVPGGIGVLGGSSGQAGVAGGATGPGAFGILGTDRGWSGAYAGVFTGNVSVTGGSTTVHNPSGHAILGTSDATNYGGLSGATSVSGGAGLIGTNSNVAGAYGGIIYGPFVVTGTKSAAVKHPDGSRRLVYCVESPESYLEDVGEDQLINGKATVHLREDFAALIDARHYYVFLTPLGSPDASLAVAERHGKHFVVAGLQHDAAFQYRIMAKRADVTAERLARFDVPEPDLAAAMHKPEIPTIPGLPGLKEHRRP